MKTGVTYKSDSIMSAMGSEIIQSDEINRTEGRLDFLTQKVGDDGQKRGRVFRSIALDQVASWRILED